MPVDLQVPAAYQKCPGCGASVQSVSPILDSQQWVTYECDSMYKIGIIDNEPYFDRSVENLAEADAIDETLFNYPKEIS